MLGASLLAVCTACCDRGFKEPDEQHPTIPATLSIADLTYRLAPESEGGSVTVTADVAVEGTVTAVNRSGNLYGSLCVESDGAALILRTDLNHLYTRYPVGCRVLLRLQGLALGRFYGAVEAGRPIAPDDYHPVGLLSTPAALGAVLFRQDETLTTVFPTTVTIAELRENQCGTLVCIDGLRYPSDIMDEVLWGDQPIFVDSSGHEIRVQVSQSADFAEQAVPVDVPCSLTGILFRERSSGLYRICLRDVFDCRY